MQRDASPSKVSEYYLLNITVNLWINSAGRIDCLLLGTLTIGGSITVHS